MLRFVGPTLLLFTFMQPTTTFAQIPDSIAAKRARIGCPSIEGDWQVTLVLDSSAVPRFSAGRSTTGMLQFGGAFTWEPMDRDYPCRTSGRFAIDPTPLWGSKLHPMANAASGLGEILTRASSAWMGGAGREDSVMIYLTYLEPGGIVLRGEVRGDTISGVWSLITGHQYGVTRPTFADGHFLITRRRARESGRLTGRWRLAGVYATEEACVCALAQFPVRSAW